MKRRAPIINSTDFYVLVVPAIDAGPADVTIPRTFKPAPTMRVAAMARAGTTEMSRWAMQNPKAVSKALRKLADFIDAP